MYTYLWAATDAQPPRVYFNLFVVWLLTGFWHGAGWNFILWGMILFAIIAIEKAGLKKILDRFKVVGHAYMIVLIPLTWMVFAITDMGQLGVYAGRLIGIGANGSVLYLKETWLNLQICTAF